MGLNHSSREPKHSTVVATSSRADTCSQGSSARISNSLTSPISSTTGTSFSSASGAPNE
jgi:hypothetical protein